MLNPWPGPFDGFLGDFHILQSPCIKRWHDFDWKKQLGMQKIPIILGSRRFHVCMKGNNNWTNSQEMRCARLTLIVRWKKGIYSRRMVVQWRQGLEYWCRGWMSSEVDTRCGSALVFTTMYSILSYRWTLLESTWTFHAFRIFGELSDVYFVYHVEPALWRWRL